MGNTHKDMHAECTCSAFRPFAGVLPSHLQGATIHHSTNFYLITRRFSKESHLYLNEATSAQLIVVNGGFETASAAVLISSRGNHNYPPQAQARFR